MGQRFAALDAQLRRASALKARHVQQIDAACVVLCSCLRLFSAQQHAAVQPLLKSLQLVLHSGAIALNAATQVAAGNHSWQPRLRQWLENQASATGALLRLTLCLPSGVSPTAALESVAPPRLVLSWLAAACDALEALTPPGATAGEGIASAWADAGPPCCVHLNIKAVHSVRSPFAGKDAGLWGTLFGVVAGLASLPAAAFHLRALQEHEQLCCRLLQLLHLPHSVAAMAVALQLPPDRRPAAFSWSSAAMAASFVAMTPPTPSLREQLGEQLDEGRLLLAAAQLLQLVPYEGSSTGPDSPGMPVEGGYWCATYLAEQLGWAATIWQYCRAVEGLVPATPENCRLGRLLLAVLPKLGRLLHATATASTAAVPWAEKQTLLTAAYGTLLFVTSLIVAIEKAGFPAQLVSTADLEGWCTGAAAALRWLSPLSTLVQDAAQQAVALDCNPQFAPTVVTLAQLVATCAESLVRSQLRPLDLEAATRAVWQLHTTACRLVHFASSTSQLPNLGAVSMQHSMLVPLLRGAALMTHLRQSLEPTGAPQPDRYASTHLCLLATWRGSPTRSGLRVIHVCRLLQAMCLAHWQALQVLLGSGGDLASQGLSRTDVVGELAHLVLHGPPALGASQELHDMLHRVVAQLREVRVQPLCRSCPLRVSCSRVHCLMYVVCVLTPAQGEAYLASSTYGMLLHARHSLHLAAMLLSSGLLCALVADLAAWSDHEAALRVRHAKLGASGQCV